MSDNHGGLYNLINAHEKRIASLIVEVEMKNKEIRKWKEAWQQADDDAYQYAEELKSLREFCRVEIGKMPPDYVAELERLREASGNFLAACGGGDNTKDEGWANYFKCRDKLAALLEKVER